MKWDFAVQLERYGPDSRQPPVSRPEAWQYCRWLAHTHYENFSVASLLLPRRLLRHFHAVYSYCRWADDLADETGSPDAALRLLDWWQRQLLDCYQGKTRHPVFIALEETIRRFDIPSRPFLDLLAAFRQDQFVASYATFADLRGYCQNSANPVGRIVLHLFRAHDEERGQLSDHICTALQLANFWQGVADDLDLGRVYLPLEDRHRFGYPDADLNARRFTPAFAELMRYEVDRSRDLFYKGYPLIDRVPREVRSEVELFIEGGLAILARIEKMGFNVLDQHPSLAPWDKGRLLAGAVWRRLRGFLQVG